MTARLVEDPPVLAVAACNGHRCGALRDLPDVGSVHRADLASLRAAIASRSDALLVSTSCLGPCDRACVVAVGWARADEVGRISWIGRPVGFALAERSERSRALTRWISGGAPDLAQLPPELRETAPGPAEGRS